MAYRPATIRFNAVGGFTAGSVAFAAADGTLTQDNANLFWDDANNRLGIGTASPQQKLHLVGNGDVALLESPGGTGGPQLRLKHAAADGGREYILLSTGSTNDQGTGNFSVFDLTAGATRWWIDSAGHQHIPDLNIILSTTTGTIIGTAITQKLGFYNATPIAQRAGAAQAAVATTAATNVGPFGYSTAAQADAIVTLVNELRAWAVAQGFIKGAA